MNCHVKLLSKLFKEVVMKKNYLFSIVVLLLLIPCLLFSKKNNDGKLLELSREFHEKYTRQKEEALRVAKEKNFPVKIDREGEFCMELMRLSKNGMPEYYITSNLNSARTIETDELWPGGGTGLNLSGDGFLIGEWDEGTVLTTHVEFDDGVGGTRVTHRDAVATNWHSTHVGGTLIAEGQDAAAQGMAFEADLDSYDWDDDDAEMADAAANDDLLISNHSYSWLRGWFFDPGSGDWLWYGDTSIDATEDFKFGFYDDTAQDWDQIAHDAPEYLIFKAASNDRDDNHVGWHWAWNGVNWVWSNAARDPDGGATGYDCLPQQSTCKNIMTVGSCQQIPGGWTAPGDVVASVFSSWGPCDDGRIKPDIVADGDWLYSTDDDFNSDYRWVGGTSMSSPAAAGSAALLQEHYENLNGDYMLAATLKGLIINTADEAGPNDGPDYMFGWGLMNSEEAVDLITADNTLGNLINENNLSNTETEEYHYYCDGTEDINVTICWTDPAGTPPADAVDPPNHMLVNDLDLRIFDSSRATYYPWSCDPANPANAATQAGDNDTDNVEQVFIDNPDAGYYYIRISHKGNIGTGQDYSLIVSGMESHEINTWTGAFNYYWHNDANWSFGHIPLPAEDVLITSDGYHPPKVDLFDEECNELTIEAGADLEIRDQTLEINGDFTIYGELEMSDASGIIYAYDDVIWESGSTADISANAVFWVYGNWDFRSGANVHLDDGIVDFAGSSSKFIRSYEENCYFNDLGSYKTGGSYIAVSGLSDETLNIHEDLYIHPNAIFNSYSNYSIVLQGYLYNNHHFNFDYGTFVFDGTSHSITSNAGDHFNNLTISSSGNTSLSDNLNVNNDLLIESGALVTNDYQIELGGDWTNNVGAGGFVEGAGTVIFNGSDGHQYCSNETFNILEIDKPSAAFRLNGTTVTCASYDWTSGALDVLSGTFTANDLVNNGLYGSYYVNPGGTINLHQDGSSWIDLEGSLTFTGGGTINVYGGSLDSYWAYSNDASITMNGGILDFINQGIYLNDHGHTLTANISGGTIRTAEGFRGNITNFNPTGGTIECYGTTDGNMSMGVGSNFYDIHINKSAALRKGDSRNEAQYIEVVERDGTITRLERANTITAISDLDINGDFVIDAGIFDTNGFDLYVAGDWENNVGDAGFIEGTQKVVFDGANAADILTNETFYDLHLDKTYANYDGLETGSGDDNGVDVTVTNNLRIYDGTMELNNPTNITIGNELDIDDGATLNANDSGTINISVVEDWFDFNTSGGFDAGSSSVVTFNGITPPNIQSVRENDYFNDIVINSGASYVRPSGTGPTIYCKNMNIISGKLKVSSYRVVVDEDMTISGTLEMSSADDTLDVENIIWESGSSDIVTDGKIFVSGDWTFNDGTNAQLGTGNTVYFDGSNSQFIYCMDSDAEFGDLVIDMPSMATWIHFSSTETMHVAGDMTVTADDIFQVETSDLLIDGILDIEDTGAMYLEDLGGTMTNNSDFTLNGELNIDGGDALIHGEFELASTGILTIDSGSFISDAPLSRGWQYLYGEMNLSDGLFEITNNHIAIESSFGDNISGGIIRTGGTLMADELNTFQPTGGTLEFTALTTGKYVHCSDGNYLHKMLVNGSNEFNLHNDLIIQNDLTIDAGSLDTNGHDIEVGGDWTNNVGDAGFLEGSQTVTFFGGNFSDITTDETFYDLTIDKTATSWEAMEVMDNQTVNVTNDLDITDGTVEMNTGSTLNVDNDLDIALDAGLNAFGDTGLNITIAGDWMNSNISYDSWLGFNPGTSTVTFNGSSNQYLTTNCTQEDFYDLVIDNSGGNFRSWDNVQVFNDLMINDGSWSDNTSSLTHFVHGDFTVAAGAGWNGAVQNTIVFKGTADQNVTFDPPTTAGYFFNVLVDKTVSRTIPLSSGEEKVMETDSSETENSRSMQVTLLTDVISLANGSLVIDEGTLDLNGQYFRCTGDVTINEGATLSIDDNAWLEVGNGYALNVNNGGTLELNGSAGNEAILTHHSDYYDLNIESGGTIIADYGIFQYMSLNGVYIKDGAIIDGTDSFNNCTFRNGEAGGTLFIIDNDQIFTADNVNFPTNTWSGASNVMKSVNSGEVTFTAAYGDFAGPMYEDDTHNRIHWDGFGPDLEITNVVWTDTNPYVCDEITATATVYNNGNVDIPPGSGFYLDLYYNLGAPPSPFEVGNQSEYIFVGIPIGDFVNVQFDMINDIAESWDSYFQIDTDEEIAELDEGNNIWGPDAITWNPLPAISDLNIHETGGDVYLNWTYPATVDYFKIYKSPDPYDFSGATVETSPINSYWEAAGTMLFYRITAVKNCTPTLILREKDSKVRRNNL